MMAAGLDTQLLGAALWPQKGGAFDQGRILAGSHRAQIAIIGAGYSGLSAALHLAEAGFDVAVIEADQPGAGASGRNAAGWLPTYFDKSSDDVVNLLGAAKGAALNQMIADSARLVPALIGKYDMMVDMRQSGIAMLSATATPTGATTDQKSAAMFPELAQRWNDFGGNVLVLDGDAVRGIAGSDRVTQALLFKDAGTLNPFAYAAGLAAAAVKAGVHFLVRPQCG